MWIVSGSKEKMVSLISSNKIDGILPIGSYLTVVDKDQVKTILLVKESYQKSLFEPSPLIVDAGVGKFTQDQECKNILYAEEIRQYPSRPDGLYSYVKPNEIARRTSQQEISDIFGSQSGYPVFLATHFLRENAVLKDDSGKPLFVNIPFYSLYLQTMICGQTGSGKTVAMKYLIEQFREHEKGAVLAINVKSIDLLTMDQPTSINDEELKNETENEWKALGLEDHELGEYSIYVPYTTSRHIEGVTESRIRYITLKTKDLEPNALLGILQNVTDRAAEALPNIFRYWKDRDAKTYTFREFINWFKLGKNNKYIMNSLSEVGEESSLTLHSGTYDAILRSLESASAFFDSPGECLPIRPENILVPGKLSVIDLSNKNTMTFGAILLRHLLSKIYEAKASHKSDIPILIVIDEVHNFYRLDASSKALEELNAIARMGRSEKIGVIFASQNPDDMPPGLNSIVNTRIFFRSLDNMGKRFDLKEGVELSALKSGYALMSNVAMPEIRFVKFPMPIKGVRS